MRLLLALGLYAGLAGTAYTQTNPNGYRSGLTAAEINAVREQLRPCFHPSVEAGKVPDIIADIRVIMNRDGTVQQSSVVDVKRYTTDSVFRSLADSGVQALRNPQCTPLHFPPEKFAQWKTFVFGVSSSDVSSSQSVTRGAPDPASFDKLARRLEENRTPDGAAEADLYKCGSLPNLFDGVAKISTRLNYMTSGEILAVNEKMISELRAGVARTDWSGSNIENRKCQFWSFIHHDMVENSMIRAMQGRGYSDRMIQDALRGGGW